MAAVRAIHMDIDPAIPDGEIVDAIVVLVRTVNDDGRSAWYVRQNGNVTTWELDGVLEQRLRLNRAAMDAAATRSDEA